MIIYRVQDKDGRGPWKPGFSHKWIVDRDDLNNLHSINKEFNCSYLDRTFYEGWHFGCGCLSVDQLKRWFIEEEYNTLLEYGYSSVKINGKVLESSSIQCLFARRKHLKYHGGIFSLYK